MMFNNRRRRSHSSRVELLLVNMSASWFFGVNICDLDFGVVQIDSVKQPVKSNTVSSRHMSHCGTSSFDENFDHGFVVFKGVQLRLALRRMCVGG